MRKIETCKGRRGDESITVHTVMAKEWDLRVEVAMDQSLMLDLDLYPAALREDGQTHEGGLRARFDRAGYLVSFEVGCVEMTKGESSEVLQSQYLETARYALEELTDGLSGSKLDTPEFQAALTKLQRAVRSLRFANLHVELR